MVKSIYNRSLTALWQATFLSWCLSPQGKKGSSHSAWSPYRGHAKSPARAPPVISAFRMPSQHVLCAVTPILTMHTHVCSREEANAKDLVLFGKTCSDRL